MQCLRAGEQGAEMSPGCPCWFWAPWCVREGTESQQGEPQNLLQIPPPTAHTGQEGVPRSALLSPISGRGN